MNQCPLHEFMLERRDEIVANAVRKTKARAPERDESELVTAYRAFTDEIIRALQEGAGLPAIAELPQRSGVAERHGGQRQRGGDAIGNLAIELGMVSDAVGDVGGREGMHFSAADYRVFNKCIDMAISSAIEQFHRQEEADAAERIGFVAHELRNALSSARMAFGAIRHGDVGVNGKTGDVLSRNLDRLEKLISHLLLAVRTGSREAEMHRIDAAALLRDLADGAVLERGVRVDVEADPSLVIEADAELLGSAVSNLVQNAIKFTHDGGRVVLRARARDADATIEVEDECGGLPEGEIQELFLPFVRASGDGRGLGLGLAITREAIEAQGASISAHDLSGKGCIFRVAGLRFRKTS